MISVGAPAMTVIVLTLVAIYGIADVAERRMRCKRLAELEEFHENHEGCDGGQWAHDRVDHLTDKLRRTHDLMRSGFEKDARHELERAIEEIEEVAA